MLQYQTMYRLRLWSSTFLRIRDYWAAMALFTVAYMCHMFNCECGITGFPFSFLCDIYGTLKHPTYISHVSFTTYRIVVMWILKAYGYKSITSLPIAQPSLWVASLVYPVFGLLASSMPLVRLMCHRFIMSPQYFYKQGVFKTQVYSI